MVQKWTLGPVKPAYGYFYDLQFGFPKTLQKRAASVPGAIASLDVDREALKDGTQVCIEQGRDLDLAYKPCTLDPNHYRGTTRDDLWSVDVVDRTKFSPFQMPTGDAAIVNGWLAEQLLRSGLWGFSLQPMRIAYNDNYPDYVAPEPLYALIFEGRKPFMKQRLDPAEPNRCCFCGFGPVVCPECNHIDIDCPKCEKTWIVPDSDHDGEGDPRTMIDWTYPPPGVMDISLWDGCDFMGLGIGGYATRRAVDFLVSIHAAPFLATPIPVNVHDITPELREKLEQARRPLRPNQP